MRTLTLAETKSHLSAVVDQVIAGEEIVITRRGRPVARIIAEPVQPAADAAAIAAQRRLGGAQGEGGIWLAGAWGNYGFHEDGLKSALRVANGLGISILSTPKGVMSDASARTANVGGEVLCTVF